MMPDYRGPLATLQILENTLEKQPDPVAFPCRPQAEPVPEMGPLANRLASLRFP